MSERLMRNQDAEQSVLAACLLEPVAITKARAVLMPADFTFPRHKLLFAAVLELHATGVTVDYVTLAAKLHERNELEAAGGKDYIAFLLDAIPTADNVQYHADLVRICALRRRLIETIDTARTAVTSGDIPLEDVAGAIQSALSTVVSNEGRRGFSAVTASEIIDLTDAIAARRDAARDGKIIGVATGYPEIDEMTFGFQPGELVIVGARPKCGKTAFVLNCALNAIVDDARSVGFVSTEMTRTELIEGAGNRLAQLMRSATASGRLSNDELARFATQLHALTGRMHIDDDAFPTLEDVIARAIDLKARHPEISLLVVDYLQRVSKRMAGRRGDEEISAVTSGMKSLAKLLGIPILAPAQVNYKESDKRESKAPTSADLQGSSGFAQDANFLFLLHRPGLFDPREDLAHVLQVSLAESRRTPKFDCRLYWHGEFMTIDSAERRDRRRSAQ